MPIRTGKHGEKNDGKVKVMEEQPKSRENDTDLATGVIEMSLADNAAILFREGVHVWLMYSLRHVTRNTCGGVTSSQLVAPRGTAIGCEWPPCGTPVGGS